MTRETVGLTRLLDRANAHQSLDLERAEDFISIILQCLEARSIELEAKYDGLLFHVDIELLSYVPDAVGTYKS